MTPRHFDALARVYDRVMRPPDPRQMQQVMGLPDRVRLLDVGGGTGRVSAGLQPLVDRLIVSDLSRPMLHEARRKGSMNAVQAHAELLPFPDCSFERVLVADALHHFCDQQRALSDILRVLTEGGRLVVEEPNIRRWPVKLVALAEKAALMRSRFLKAEEISAMLQGLCRRIRIMENGNFFQWIVADK